MERDHKEPQYQLKMIVDYSWSAHCMNRGLLAEDHLRMTSDLEKIAQIPLLGEIKFQLDEGHYYSEAERSSNKPVRYIKIVCDIAKDERKNKIPKKLLVGKKKDSEPTGRLLGYIVIDELDQLHSSSKGEIGHWRNRIRGQRVYCSKSLGEIVLSLRELDRL